jgi:hypothetical protein
MSLIPQWYVEKEASCDSVNKVQIHVSRSKDGEETPDLSGKAIKLMHRFTEEQVKAQMDVAEAKPS